MTAHGKISISRNNRSYQVGLVATVQQLFSLWATRRKARLALARLDDYLLRDIGLDRGIADREISRRFWQD